MPRFEPDLTQAHAFIPILDRTEAELEVVGYRPFQYTKDDGNVVAGVTFDVNLVGTVDSEGQLDRSDEGQRLESPRFYVHSKGAYGMLKRFVMSCLGYTRETEAEFNEWFAEREFWVDSENDEAICGSGYQEVVGKQVRVTLDKRMWNEQEQQDFKGWRSIAG